MQNQDQHITLDKELRRDIDAIIQRLKWETYPLVRPIREEDSDAVRPSEERQHAIKKLQEAVMWLAEDIAAIEHES